MAERVRVATLAELGSGCLRAVLVDGLPIALANIDGTIYAFGDVCRHEGGPLSAGILIGDTITCPWHGWTYNVRTGKSIVPPVGIRIPTYPVVIEDGVIYLDIEWAEAE